MSVINACKFWLKLDNQINILSLFVPPPQIIPFSKGRYLTLREFFSTEPNFAQSILAWAIVVVSYKMVQSTSLSRRLLINKYKIINISQISHQLLMNVMSYVYYLWILYHSVFQGIRTHPLCGVMGFGQSSVCVFIFNIYGATCMVSVAGYMYTVPRTQFFSSLS